VDMLEREECVISGEPDLEELFTFSDFPVFMGCTDQSRESDVVSDMRWWISRSSGLIQLKSTLPLETVYSNSHGAGAVGALWAKHHREFAAFLGRTQPKRVLEIGGAHGILEIEFRSAIGRIPWTIVEPNPAPAEGCQATFVEGFFDETFVATEGFDTVVHSHVFEHFYQPDQFIRNLSRFMPLGTRMVFSLPNLQVMLERKYTNFINFEHTVLLSENYVDYLLAKHGFQVTAKEHFLDDHSVFYAAVRTFDGSSRPPHLLDANSYSTNRDLYLAYVDYHRDLVSRLNAKMRADDSGPIFLFGAHVFSQYLVAFGLDTSIIQCLIDNDRAKHGRRLYGTDLWVESPQCLEGLNMPRIILRSGVYNDEVKADILKNINGSAQFLE
jgi:hypothetical protein